MDRRVRVVADQALGDQDGVGFFQTTSRNGLVAAIRIATDDDHLILISDRGKLIRVRVRDVPVMGRATQGVRVMRLDDGEAVAAIERLAEPEESDIAEEKIEAPSAEDVAEDEDTTDDEAEAEGDDEGDGDAADGEDE